MASFSAQVLQFNDDAMENLGMIFSRSVFKLEEEMKRDRRTGGGLTPVDTANMIRSILVSTTTMPRVDVTEQQYAETSFIIPPSHVGKPVWIGVQAVYGPRQNYGFVGTDSLGRSYNQAGAFFVEGAGAKWQKFVTEAESEIN